MSRRGARALAVLAISVAISACGTFAGKDRYKADLERDAEMFSDNFQWQRWAQAAQQVHPDDRAAFLMFGTQLGDRLRVTGYEIAGVEIDEGGDSASATVLFQVYRPPSMTEQTLADQQRWVRKGGDWYVRPVLERY